MQRDIFDVYVEEIFNRALPFSDMKRQAFLRRACKDKPKIKNEVESLLSAVEPSERFFSGFSHRVSSLPLGGLEHDNAALSRVGPWHVQALIGEGGMGRVYKVARADGEYHQRAALKILSISAVGEVAQYRFREERQILAGLSHKNIVQLLDGGVTDKGLPYFVMEYVDGLRIDDHCDATNLGIHGRLLLFIDVCHAVQYAHDNMVIHRDLKPSNILVGCNAEVKLLDFGIAKILGDNLAATNATAPASRHLTPAYASPQMLRGESVDVKTDVYSLGVVLHKLLCATEPYKNCENVADFINAHNASENALAGPSLVASSGASDKSLRGDLHNIMRKALAVNSSQRYASVKSFADDVQNYLNGFPVEASQGNFFYKAKKLFRRHFYAVIFGWLCLTVVCLSAYFYMMKNRESQVSRNFAGYQQQRALLANDFITLLLNKVGLENKAMSVESLLQLSESVALEQSRHSPKFSGWLLFEIAMKYGLVAQEAKAVELMAVVEDIARQQQDIDLLKTVLCSQSYRGYALDPNLAIAKFNQAQQLNPKGKVSIEGKIACAIADARSLEYTGQAELALNTLDRAIQEFSMAHASNSIMYFKLFNNKGVILYRMKRYKALLKNNNDLLVLLRQTGHDRTSYYFTLLGNRAILFEAMGELKQATQIREQLIQLTDNSGLKSQLPMPIWIDHARCLSLLGRHAEAAAIYQLQFANLNSQLSWDFLRAKKFDLYLGYSYHLVMTKEIERAESYILTAQQLAAALPEQANKHIKLLKIEFVKAMLLKQQGLKKKADTAFKVLLEKLNLPGIPRQGLLLHAYYRGLRVLIEQGHIDDAQQQALSLLSATQTYARETHSSGDVGVARLLLAHIYRVRGKRQAAAEKYRSARQALTLGYGGAHPYLNLNKSVESTADVQPPVN